MTITVSFKEEQKELLNRERYYHAHPVVRRKMEALWLKSQGLAHQEICRLASISKPTLCSYTSHGDKFNFINVVEGLEF